ncbi:ABC transporter ATP-binding protein [Dehalobacter restrictus]|uniref:ATP-binding cassette domain-containing protein n=1 Tax=Dehalobacter restrictus TaxID=55583 RepID=A0A857DMV6_9FIRM|nr:ABC transporter ATP-binding protein [Dehalobacter restrictus]QHA01699.1 ATP-binding cassette domain-containing protein [Dehalobacter restrictus]
MGILVMENVTKKFGDLIAVDNMNISIAKGEIFGLLGPNGAGKSTAINMIIGLLSIDKGTISILNKDTKRNKAFSKKNTGIVPQDIAIYEDLTTLENVKFFAGLYGLRGDELNKAAAEALEFTGLSDKANSYPKSFSGGMKRRLNIACAITHKPKLIIMDEPTVGIDPQSRNHILQSVKKLNQMGCTIIYTSHYMEEVEEICSRIAIMDHGKVIALGSKEELKALLTDSNIVWITVNDSITKAVEDKIREIPGVLQMDIEENTLKISTAKEVHNLDKIICYFTENKFPIKSVESRTPDLETVFLSLTGRSLRD